MEYLAAKIRLLSGDRIQWLAILIVACFVSVLMLKSQSGASYPTYVLALVMALSYFHWRDVLALRLMRWVVALLVWLSVSTLWSEPFALRETYSVLVRGFLVFFFVVAFAECVLRGQLQRWMDGALTFVGAAAVIAALINYYVTNPADGRLNGLGQLDTHVIAAIVYGVVLLFVLRAFQSSSLKSVRLGALLVALTIVVAVILSDSRNAWMSVAIGVGVFVLAHRCSDTRQFAITVASMVAFLLLLMNDATRELMLPRGDSFRVAIWSETMSAILDDSLLFGRGILTEDAVQIENLSFAHPHNLYLAIVHQGGLVALALYLVVLYKTIRLLFDHFETKDAKFALSVLALALTAHLLDGHELIDKVGETWFLIWLPISIAIGLSWKPSEHG